MPDYVEGTACRAPTRVVCPVRHLRA